MYDYSAQAIDEALDVLEIQGHITIQDLLNICQKDKVMKPPWIEEEEDKYFTGYKDLTEMLEDMNVDVKKVIVWERWQQGMPG